MRATFLVATTVCAFAAAALAADAPRLTGPTPALESPPAPPLARTLNTEGRPTMRNYPEQPPVIPHAITGYQLNLGTNRCLTCHRRQYTEASGAPMISVTHYMDRAGQMLADVSPRRYFCTQCHVEQTDAEPLVENTFVDMDELVVSPGSR
jgi:cytochrome c-type protein NapB